ncbi:MAG: GNAT family N-acetyltransferase [Ignavibacteriales bacterium]|nr:GNAT family N-acetyltransferase [Ignavibacteriales bacterium]
MIIKRFSEDLLPAVAKLCRQNMNLDIMPDFLLKEKTFEDPDFNPNITLVGFNDSTQDLVGFIQGVIRIRETGKMGYIKLICVDSNDRRKHVASNLYGIVEEKMKADGVNAIRVYESWPNYFMPGLDPYYTEAVCFFERKGFKKIGDTSNLEADLAYQNFETTKSEEVLAQKGVSVKRAELSDKERVIGWIRENFKAWESEVTSSFENNPISIHLAEMEGKIIAFSGYEGNNKGTGWFGPMGTAEAARGKNVGGVLYRRCLADMKEIGFVKAIIPWVGPIPFYMHYSNAKVKRVFWRFEKQIIQ